jgi:hypothetical protein
LRLRGKYRGASTPPVIEIVERRAIVRVNFEEIFGIIFRRGFSTAST